MSRRPKRASTAPRAVGSVLALALLGADAPAPGAYCPLPEKGETPRCLDPAQAEYEAFFAALDEPEPADAALAEVEAEVARGASAGQPYLALSSLAYGYWRLTERATVLAGNDPRLVARLERWNALLAEAYAVSPDDARYREAVRAAALDLERRVDFPLTCPDARGEPTECNSTETVLRAISQTSDRVGIRGALAQLWRRVFGGDVGADATAPRADAP